MAKAVRKTKHNKVIKKTGHTEDDGHNHDSVTKGKFDKVKTFQLSYMNSDAYLERLRSSGYENPEGIRDLRIKSLLETSVKEITGNRGSHSYAEDNKLVVNTELKGHSDLPVIAHEVGHIVGGSYSSVTDKSSITGKKALNLKDVKDLEDKNKLYRESPSNLYNSEVQTGIGEVGSLTTDYSEGYPSTVTVNEGSQSLSATRNPDYNPENIESKPFLYPKGFSEEVKKKMESDYKVNRLSWNELKESRSESKEIESNRDYILDLIGNSKKFQRKGWDLDNIPKGENKEVDEYRAKVNKSNSRVDLAKAKWKEVKNLNQGYILNSNFSTEEGGKDRVFKKGASHDISSTESYSDLVGMRYYLNDEYGISPESEMTPEIWNDVVEKEKDKKRNYLSVPDRFIKKYKNSDDASYILNNIAMENNPNNNKEITMAEHGARIDLDKLTHRASQGVVTVEVVNGQYYIRDGEHLRPAYQEELKAVAQGAARSKRLEDMRLLGQTLAQRKKTPDQFSKQAVEEKVSGRADLVAYRMGDGSWVAKTVSKGSGSMPSVDVIPTGETKGSKFSPRVSSSAKVVKLKAHSAKDNYSKAEAMTIADEEAGWKAYDKGTGQWGVRKVRIRKRFRS